MDKVIYNVDMTPLVSCKECIHFDGEGFADFCGFCPKIENPVDADFFCAYGEKHITSTTD